MKKLLSPVILSAAKDLSRGVEPVEAADPSRRSG